MRIFPQEEFLLTSTDEIPKSISLLEKNLLHKDQFVSNWDNQEFIGELKGSNFELKLSKEILGDFSVLTGRFTDRSVIIKANPGLKIKQVFTLLSVFALIGIIYSIIKGEILHVALTVMTLLIFRFLLVIIFNAETSKSIMKLKEILHIT